MSNECEANRERLLTPQLRQYIDHHVAGTNSRSADIEDSGPSDVTQPQQAKREVLNRTQTTDHVSDVLRTVVADMERIEQFYTEIEQDRATFQKLVDQHKEAIALLTRTGERWQGHTDDGPDEKEYDWRDKQFRLREPLSSLYDGLEAAPSPRKEYNERIDAVKAVCDEGLVELFTYIMTTPGQKQLFESKLMQEQGGKTWQQYATEILEEKHELVFGKGNAEKQKYFTPTQRGRIVFEALDSLLESSCIDDWQQEDESRETAVVNALSELHHSGV